MVYSLVKKIIQSIRNRNREKYLNILISSGLKIGNNVDFASNFFIDPSHCYMISIGSNCTFSPNVRLIAHDASTRLHMGYTKLGQINIGDNCYFGDSVIILPNVSVGNDSIVAAGAIVTKSVPPRSVVAGAPAKIISDLDSYLFKSSLEMKKRKVFSSDYCISKLDNEKTKELLEATKDGVAYIK